MSAFDEVRIPFRFHVREIRRLAPGELPPAPSHAEALGPDHHHLPMRIELDPSPELDAIVASFDTPGTEPPQPAPRAPGDIGDDGLGFGIVGRRRRGFRAAANRTLPA